MTDPLDPKDAEKQLREAAKSGRVEFADSFEIEGYARELAVLMADVLGLNSTECFVSDMSSLSDFCFCGAGFNGVPGGATSEQDAVHWESWVVEKVRLRFGIVVLAGDSMLNICQRIRTEALPGAGLN